MQILRRAKKKPAKIFMFRSQNGHKVYYNAYTSR